MLCDGHLFQISAQIDKYIYSYIYKYKEKSVILQAIGII